MREESKKTSCMPAFDVRRVHVYVIRSRRIKDAIVRYIRPYASSLKVWLFSKSIYDSPYRVTNFLSISVWEWRAETLHHLVSSWFTGSLTQYAKPNIPVWNVYKNSENLTGTVAIMWRLFSSDTQKSDSYGAKTWSTKINW